MCRATQFAYAIRTRTPGVEGFWPGNCWAARAPSRSEVRLHQAAILSDCGAGDNYQSLRGTLVVRERDFVMLGHLTKYTEAAASIVIRRCIGTQSVAADRKFRTIDLRLDRRLSSQPWLVA